MSAHTAGPWEASDRGDYGDFDGNSNVITADDRRIAVVQNSGTEEADANARLIAAAPCMAAALDVMIEKYAELADSGDCGNLDSKSDPEVITARDILAKATGEQP